MPPIKRYDWLCLRAIRPRHPRCYSTTETSSTDGSSNDTPPLEPSSEPPLDEPDSLDTARSTFTPHTLLPFLEKQDTIALRKLRTHLHKMQSTTHLTETTLLSYRSTPPTIHTHPTIPPYTLLRSNRALLTSTRRSKALSNNILANIDDLENTLYPYEKGPLETEVWKEKVKGLGREALRELSVDMKNEVDGQRKRFSQKMGGLGSLVDGMREGLGLEVRRRRLGGSLGSEVGWREGEGRGEIVRRFGRRERKEEGESGAQGSGGGAVTSDTDAVSGTGKVEAEAQEAVRPTETATTTTDTATITGTEDTTTDTIGTAKIEAEAEVAKSPASPTPSMDFSYSPMELAEAGLDPQPTPQQTSKAENKTLRDIARATHPSASRPKSKTKNISGQRPMDSLIASLRMETGAASLGNEEAAEGYGQSAPRIEEKLDPEGRKPNPFD